MFIHMVLFKIKKHHVKTYLRDCRMWAKEAAKHPGFIGAQPLFRTNEKNQYASSYTWKNERAHNQFMAQHHDRLVGLSKCPVSVVGYFNFETSQRRASQAVGENWRKLKK